MPPDGRAIFIDHRRREQPVGLPRQRGKLIASLTLASGLRQVVALELGHLVAAKHKRICIGA